MAVVQPDDELLEHPPGHALAEVALWRGPNKLRQVAAGHALHRDRQVRGRQEQLWSQGNRISGMTSGKTHHTYNNKCNDRI